MFLIYVFFYVLKELYIVHKMLYTAYSCLVLIWQ